MKHQLIHDLEELVDGNGLAFVFSALACVCNEKADHLRINWPEMSRTARVWDRAAAKLDKLSTDALAISTPPTPSGEVDR